MPAIWEEQAKPYRHSILSSESHLTFMETVSRMCRRIRKGPILRGIHGGAGTNGMEV